MTFPSDRLVVLGVVGVLSKLYWQGRIAFIGGGLTTGIHNVMEPAIARLAVLFGPKYHHAHEAEELLKDGGGFCINNKNEFLSKIHQLITDNRYYRMTSLAATDVIHKHLGSSTRIIRNILHD
jgi:3-deoxy-D-manno-octulosonic-acid transferase